MGPTQDWMGPGSQPLSALAQVIAQVSKVSSTSQAGASGFSSWQRPRAHGLAQKPAARSRKNDLSILYDNGYKFREKLWSN